LGGPSRDSGAGDEAVKGIYVAPKVIHPPLDIALHTAGRYIPSDIITFSKLSTDKVTEFCSAFKGHPTVFVLKDISAFMLSNNSSSICPGISCKTYITDK
jgi:hypothetical protein